MNSLGFASWPASWVVSAVILLILFSVWFEWRKKSKFLAGRLIAVALLGLSLLGIILRPFYTSSSSAEILLLTHGYSTAQQDSILKQHPHLKLMRTPECPEIKKSTVANDDFLEEKGGQIKFILGEGLSGARLEIMAKKNFKFVKTQVMGIVSLHIPVDAVENNKTKLTGVLNADAAGQLRLIGPGGIEDSTQFNKGAGQEFSLSIRPRQSGNFVYQLEIQQGHSILREPVPLVVQEEQPLKILFLQKFPTAETKNLKDFLGQRNHALTLRYQVSKNTYRHEFVNAAEVPIRKISSDILNSFDLLFVDTGTLQALSGRERQDLKNSIQAGMGVVVLPSDDTKNLQWFWNVKFNPGTKDTAHVQLASHKKLVFRVVPVDAIATDEIYPEIVAGPRVLSGYTLQGLGKIGFVLLQETYRIKLEGNEQDYAHIWTDLITKISRKKSTDQLTLNTPFPVYPHEPLAVSVLSADPLLLADSVSIPLTEDVSIDGIWHSKIWAGKPGWHELKTKNATRYYFIPDTNNWKSLGAANRAQATRNAESVLHSNATVLPEIKSVPLLFFYFLFLISAGFLWLAPKLG